jgi:hypothetical protein
MNLAIVAEYANTLSAISAVVMVVAMHVYLVYLFRAVRGGSSPVQFATDFTMQDLYQCLIGISGMLVFEGWGAVITRVTVWYWRRVGIGGGGGAMTTTQVSLMVAGAVFLIIGRVGITHFLTQRALGYWPTLVSITAMLLATLWYVF